MLQLAAEAEAGQAGQAESVRAVCTAEGVAGLVLQEPVVGMEVSHLATDLYGQLWTGAWVSLSTPAIVRKS